MAVLRCLVVQVHSAAPGRRPLEVAIAPLATAQVRLLPEVAIAVLATAQVPHTVEAAVEGLVPPLVHLSVMVLPI